MSEKERDDELDENTFYNVLSAPIYTYRLTDGSYIVAEEIQNEELNEDEELDDDMLYCLMPGLILLEEEGFSIRPWNVTSTNDLTEIQFKNVVCRSEAVPEMKLKYFELIVGNRNIEPDREDVEYLDELLEEFKETFTQIESKSPAKESPYKKRWDWNPELN